MTADQQIVAAWIKGWILARETAPPVPYKDGFRVDVGWPQQAARYVFASMSPAISELARTIADPWIFLMDAAFSLYDGRYTKGLKPIIGFVNQSRITDSKKSSDFGRPVL